MSYAWQTMYNDEKERADRIQRELDAAREKLAAMEAYTARLEKALQPFVDAWHNRTMGAPSTAFSAGDILVRTSLDHYREAAQLDADRKEGKP